MENQLKLKGASALELLFVAFVLFKALGIPPINGWSYFGLVASPLYVQWVLKYLNVIWVDLGFEKQLYAAIEMRRYNRKLKKSIADYDKLNKKQRDERLAGIKKALEKSNAEIKVNKGEE